MSAILPNTRPYPRIKYYTDFINDTAKKIGFQEKVNLSIKEVFCDENFAHPTFNKNGYELKNVIELNLSFFIKAKDLPKQLIIHNMNEPKIQEERYMRNVITWINSYFGTQTLTYPLSRVQKGVLTMLLHRASQPELLEKSRQWEIVHEMQHLALNHIQNRNSLQYIGLKKMFGIGLLGAGGYAFSLAVSAPFLVNPLLGGICISAIVYTKYLSERNDCCISKENECEADEYAVKHLKDKSGAVWYFQTKLSWIQQFAPEKESDDVDRTFHTHPSRKERLARIEKSYITQD
jgi:Peptidase family M48